MLSDLDYTELFILFDPCNLEKHIDTKWENVSS